jgi:hypothetical protein
MRAVAPPLSGLHRLIAFGIAVLALSVVAIVTRSTQFVTVVAGTMLGLLTWLGSGRPATAQT